MGSATRCSSAPQPTASSSGWATKINVRPSKGERSRIPKMDAESDIGDLANCARDAAARGLLGAKTALVRCRYCLQARGGGQPQITDAANRRMLFILRPMS